MPRGAHFDHFHQSEAARKRAAMPSFPRHNQAIAPDGPDAQSAYMRAPKGSRLLSPWHIQFLRLEHLQIDIDQGCAFSDEDRRLLFGSYVWKAIWQFLPSPDPPSREAFLAAIKRVTAHTRQGKALDDPLEVVYLAPNDFCKKDGTPLRPVQQRRLFRAAMRAGRTAAEQWSQADLQQRRLERGQPVPRIIGRRRPMVERPVTLAHPPSRAPGRFSGQEGL